MDISTLTRLELCRRRLTLYPGTPHLPLDTSWVVRSSISGLAATTSSYGMVSQRQCIVHPTRRTPAHTTVKSSNGRAVSMFSSVLSKSLNSASTLPLVSPALFTACASKASIALSCLLTSYVAGLNCLKCCSISSMTAVFLRVLRKCWKSTV